MNRRRISASERARIFAAHEGCCHICGHKIDGGRERWDVEHIIPLALGGADEGENLAPAHTACHAPKSAEDAGHIAKAKRMNQREAGIRRQPRNPLPGSRGSKWKKRMNGKVEPR